MRCRLLIAYRRDGVRIPAGETVDLDDQDIEILGSLAEPVEEKELPAEPVEEKQKETPLKEPVPVPEQSGADAGKAQAADSAEQPETQDVRPALPVTLAAMDLEDPGREKKSWWTRAGKPEVAELRRRGHVISAAERDRAWEEHLSNRAT